MYSIQRNSKRKYNIFIRSARSWTAATAAIRGRRGGDHRRAGAAAGQIEQRTARAAAAPAGNERRRPRLPSAPAGQPAESWTAGTICSDPGELDKRQRRESAAAARARHGQRKRQPRSTKAGTAATAAAAILPGADNRQARRRRADPARQAPQRLTANPRHISNYYILEQRAHRPGGPFFFRAGRSPGGRLFCFSVFPARQLFRQKRGPADRSKAGARQGGQSSRRKTPARPRLTAKNAFYYYIVCGRILLIEC